MAKGGGGTSTTNTVQELAPEQQELLSLVIPTAQQFAENPPTLYPGSTVAGFTPLQQQAQQMQVANAATADQLYQQGAGANQFLTSGAVLDPNYNPGLQGAIQAAIDPLNDQFLNTILPNIRSDAITAGGFGGSKQYIAQGLAAEGLQEASAAAAANIINPAYQAGLGAFTQGIQNIPSLQQSAFVPAQAIDAVGAAQQYLAQQQLTEEAQQYLAQQMIPFNIAQDIAALAFGIGGGSATSTSNLPSSGTDPLQAILGGAALALPFIFCWVAQAIYQGHSDWMFLRAWIARNTPAWFVRLYAKKGPGVAQWLIRRKRLCAALRFFTDFAVRREKLRYGG